MPPVRCLKGARDEVRHREDMVSDSCPPLPLSFPTNWTRTGGSAVGPCVSELGKLTSQCSAFRVLTCVLTVIFPKATASQGKSWHLGTSYSRFYKTSPLGACVLGVIRHLTKTPEGSVCVKRRDVFMTHPEMLRPVAWTSILEIWF